MLAGGLSWLSFFNVFKAAHVEPKQLVFGIPYEIVQRMEKIDASPGFYDDEGPLTQESRGTHVAREWIRNIFLQLVKENNIELYLNTLAINVIKEEGVLKGLILQNRFERFAVMAKVVIDASGDGDIAYRSGANCKYYDDHLVGMAFGMSNVNFNKALIYGEEKEALVHKAFGQKGAMKGKLVKFAIRTGKIPELNEKVAQCGIHNSFTIICSNEGEATYVNGVNTPRGNGVDSRLQTDTIIRLRQNIYKSEKFLNENIPGFENAYISWTGQNPGSRHTRYVECEYDITTRDVSEGVVFEDSIGLFGAQDAHFKGYVIEGGCWYGIPYRAIVPKFVENLLVVGRMLSSEWVAWMSTRLTCACFLQGQAAGTAAALSIKEGVSVRNVNIQKLRENLRQDGVYLG
jgi:hypothetical protein